MRSTSITPAGSSSTHALYCTLFLFHLPHNQRRLWSFAYLSVLASRIRLQQPLPSPAINPRSTTSVMLSPATAGTLSRAQRYTHSIESGGFTNSRVPRHLYLVVPQSWFVSPTPERGCVILRASLLPRVWGPVGAGSINALRPRALPCPPSQTPSCLRRLEIGLAAFAFALLYFHGHCSHHSIVVNPP